MKGGPIKSVSNLAKRVFSKKKRSETSGDRSDSEATARTTSGSSSSLSRDKPGGRRSATSSGRIRWGRRIVSGQGGFNPFILCMCCCGGTCTAQYGCIINGIVQLVYGFYIGCFYAMKIIYPESKSVFESIQVYHSPENKKRVLATKIYERYASLLGNVVFGFAAAIILINAAVKLSKVSLIVYIATMFLGLIYRIAVVVLSSWSYVRLKVEPDVAIFLRQFIFRGFPVLYTIYYIFCAVGLLIQIRSGEYDMVYPQHEEENPAPEPPPESSKIRLSQLRTPQLPAGTERQGDVVDDLIM